jgi:hypothetical protein
MATKKGAYERRILKHITPVGGHCRDQLEEIGYAT